MVLTLDILRVLSPYRQHTSRFGTNVLRDREAETINYDMKLELMKYDEMNL
jgi:hypothetical protein